jgi:hypothetical protein
MQYTLDRLIQKIKGMAKELCFISMAVDMRVNGRKMFVMEEAMRFILMEIFTMEDFKREKQMVMEFINGQMARNMMGNGTKE